MHQMDFFARQDQARRSTRRLVIYFALAVVGIVTMVYLVSVLVFAGMQPHVRGGGRELALWHPTILLYSALGTLAVIAAGSLFQMSALSAGGSVVAESLGGTLVDSRTRNPHERRLLNVVEEMAIASGVPMPKVYVLENESAINAFAAGHSPSDAAVAVTRGALETFSRDELQGVMGHEFSHILNGDMRLNLRLMGIIFGILCLATIGRILLRTRGRKNPLPLFGLALILIGGLGVFFGRLIQAAVSRQREFLADAAAVQFTRNPAGLAGALKKLAAVGSQLQSERAAEACHMFFGNGVRSSFLEWFATHPPLEERIRAIEKGWDGQVPRELARVATAPESSQPPSPVRPPIVPLPTAAAGFSGSAVRPEAVLSQLGNPTPQHLRYAAALCQTFPESFQKAAHDPRAAQALVFALLVSSDAALRDRQLLELERQLGAAMRGRFESLLTSRQSLGTRARLPLVNLALPALRQMSGEEYAAFGRALKWLAESDRQIDLFEFVLLKALQRHLAPHFTSVRPPAVKFNALSALGPDVEVLLSAMAHVGNAEAREAQRAFASGLTELGETGGALQLRGRGECGLDRIDVALQRAVQAAAPLKRQLLAAAAKVVAADGFLQEREAELLRAVADTLDCPIPPLLEPEAALAMG